MGRLRAISVKRLSVLTDETTSPERQQAANEQAAASIGAEIIGEAIDLGVSASKTTPFERPELSKWLARPDEFDALLFWRFDRAVRSMADLNDLAKWARDHRKYLAFAEGPGGMLKLDFRNGVDLITQLVLQIFAFAAEFEAQAIRDRVTSAQAAMRTMPLRWRGARPPYGYMPAELETGGWTLVPAEAIEGAGPAPAAIIERIIQGIMGNPADGTPGKTLSAIVAELNAEGIPSPRDWWSLVKGRGTGGKTGGAKEGKAVVRERFNWTPAMAGRLLRSPSLVGWKMHDGNPVRDSEGAPVLATAEPILTREEFDAVIALLDSRGRDSSVRKDTKALLLGVIHCAACGGRLYLNTKYGTHPTYKCNAQARGEKCPAPSHVRGDWADEYVEREFLRQLGPMQVITGREVPGYDPAPEIAATLAEFEEHQAQEGRQRSKAAREAWQRRADALDARLVELESREVVPAHTEAIESKHTYWEMWHDTDTAGRRNLLLDAGARLEVRRGTRGGWRSLDESRVSFYLADELLEVAVAGASISDELRELEEDDGTDEL